MPLTAQLRSQDCRKEPNVLEEENANTSIYKTSITRHLGVHTERHGVDGPVSGPIVHPHPTPIVNASIFIQNVILQPANPWLDAGTEFYKPA